MKYTIALTGATGFIGATIARRLLAEGCKIRALTRATSDRSPLAGLDVHWVEGALENLDSLSRLVFGVEAVVHCAGAVRGATEDHFKRINVDGVARLVYAAARQHPLPRFLLISSLAAREPELSFYASSKRQGEAILAAQAGQKRTGRRRWGLTANISPGPQSPARNPRRQRRSCNLCLRRPARTGGSSRTAS